MNIIFVIDANGKIVRKITTSIPQNVYAETGQEIIANPENANMIFGRTHFYDKNLKQFLEYSAQEKQDLAYERIKDCRPMFAGDETDAQIDEILQRFYFGKVEPGEWKKNNYAYIRKFFYPDFASYIDSQAKIANGDPGGQDELNSYYSQCIDVKKRFPKANTGGQL